MQEGHDSSQAGVRLLGWCQEGSWPIAGSRQVALAAMLFETDSLQTTWKHVPVGWPRRNLASVTSLGGENAKVKVHHCYEKDANESEPNR